MKPGAVRAVCATANGRPRSSTTNVGKIQVEANKRARMGRLRVCGTKIEMRKVYTGPTDSWRDEPDPQRERRRRRCPPSDDPIFTH